MAKEILPLFPSEAAAKDGAGSKSMHFRGFSKAKNLYITGHSTGAIKFWDISCPLMRPVLSITQQVTHLLLHDIVILLFKSDHSY